MFNRLRRLFSSSSTLDQMLAYPEGKRIYREFHKLRREQMDQDALKVINRLNRHGYRSYLVGGCVRDMILGKKPKDFDVVTSATPAQIRKVFTNSRAIGRRFKIVHVVFRGGKVIEVSTFRSLPEHRFQPGKNQDYMLKRDNEYGNPREDAARRDFTINALFFDPRNESIIDYVGGFEDIEARRINVIGDPEISFKEDPVRMLRAAKFAGLLGMSIDTRTLKGIRRYRSEISKASAVRLLDEYTKIFRTGRSADVFSALADTGLFKPMFPEAWQASGASKQSDFRDSSIGRRLVVADRMLSEREDLTITIFIALLLADVVRDVFFGKRTDNIMDYVKSRMLPAAERMQVSGKDRDRLIQMFISQGRFMQSGGRRRVRPEVFREKIFFYEAFMLFKIYALAEGNEEAIQKAMFWEIGPRGRPPEAGKVVTTFPQRMRNQQNRRHARQGRSGRRP